MPSCEAAANKPCLVLLFSNAPLGSPGCRQIRWPSARAVLGEVEMSLRRNSLRLAGCRLETGWGVLA